MILKSIKQLKLDNIEEIFSNCSFFEKNDIKNYNILKSKQIATIFLEPSTRTQLSFQKAVHSLGGDLISISNIAQIRSNPFDEESIDDALKVMSYYCDCLVFRSKISLLDKNLENLLGTINFINAGDARNEHPLQALGDCWLLSQRFKNFDFPFGFIGDCTARVFRSLFFLLVKLGVSEFHYYSTNFEEMPQDILNFKKDIKIMCHDNIDTFLKSVHIVEVIPYKIPFDAPVRKKDSREVIITKDLINSYNPNTILLHPGPRNFELSPSVDNLKNSLFFEQARIATFMKMAILQYVNCR